MIKTKNRSLLIQKVLTYTSILVCSLSLVSCTISFDTSSSENSIESSNNPVKSAFYLKDIFKDDFLIGAAVQPSNFEEYGDTLNHFNSFTLENHMKWSRIEPEEGVYNFEPADKVADYARSRNVYLRGHTFVWHRSCPSWVIKETDTKEDVLKKIDTRIETMMTHFGDDVYAWDVANEVIKNSITDAQLASGDIYRKGSEALLDSNCQDFYSKCGVDYIKEAFRKANEMKEKLNLDCELYYNDYSIENPNKRKAVVKLVEMLREDGIEIDGIGIQGHYRLPNYQKDKDAFLNNLEDSIKTFTALGLNVQLTELDVRIYGSNDDPERFDALPYKEEVDQAELYRDIFALALQYTKPRDLGYGVLNSITTWGIADDRNCWNLDTHKEYPLIFGVDHEPKAAYYQIAELK